MCEDVLALIEPAFLIQLGTDFAATDDGRQFFAKSEADRIFLQLYEGLQHVLETGNQEQAEEAWVMMCNFRILPYRVH
jgi:hypothetical protein